MITKLKLQLKNKGTLRAIQGGILALGAPLGWLLIQYFVSPNISNEIEKNIGLYCYMLFVTQFSFVCFGLYIGRKEDLISELSIKDSLTGIYNLRFYMERLKHEIANSNRYNEPLSLVFFDLEHFKKLNDNFGHPAGDMVLKEVTQAISSITRTQDVFARVGGEEFVVLLPKCNLKNAQVHAEKMRSKIEKLRIYIKTGKYLSVTISSSVVEFIKGEELEQFNKRIDHKQ